MRHEQTPSLELVNVERHLSGGFEQLTTCWYYRRNVVSAKLMGFESITHPIPDSLSFH